ncbi:MAG: OmpA family protein [Acidimicrobiia bacterium]|nr:OmpA family protein [Acidimicrobiia bacterium]
MADIDSSGGRGVPSSLFLLLAVWIAVILVTLVWGIGNAEAKLQDATRAALQDGGYGIAVDVSGRDATLYGTVSSEVEAEEIVMMIDGIPGVRNVNSELVVIQPVEPAPVAPQVSMRLIGDAVTLLGRVPDEEIVTDLVVAAEEQFGIDRVVNGLSVAENVANLPWLGRVKDVFVHLGDLRSGGFVAEEEGFTVNGEVISETVRTEIEQELRLIFGEALPITSNLTIAVLPAPTFSASGSGGVVTLQGRFPNQETVDQIADAARRLHPGTTIINSMAIREVAGSTWLQSIDGLLDVVTRLDPWTIDVAEGQVTITGLGVDTESAEAIGVLTEEVVAGQLSVVTDVEANPAAVALQLTQLLEGFDIFASDEATITAEGAALLDEAILVLRDNPSTRVVVEAHTDDQGAAQDNLALSQERAEAVVAYLVAGGIDSGRLTAIGYGEERPIADNVTDEGRAQNRRIEFVIEEGGG